MIYFYWLTALGFALALSVLVCVAGEASEDKIHPPKD